MSRPTSRPVGTVAVVVALAAGLAVAGCGKKKSRRAPAPTAGSAVAPNASATPTTPTAPVALVVGVPACDALFALMAKAMACEQLTGARSTMEANLDNQRRRFAAWAALPDAERAATLATASGQCQSAQDGIERLMTSAGCAP